MGNGILQEESATSYYALSLVSHFILSTISEREYIKDKIFPVYHRLRTLPNRSENASTAGKMESDMLSLSLVFHETHF